MCTRHYLNEITEKIAILAKKVFDEKLDAVIKEGYTLPGIYYIKAWLNEGQLNVGDDIMYVLIGGDIRPNVVDALQHIVSRIKNECVEETEIY